MWRGHSCLPRPDSSGRLPGALESTSRRVGTPQTESLRHVVAEKLFLRGPLDLPPAFHGLRHGNFAGEPAALDQGEEPAIGSEGVPFRIH